MVIIIGAGIAGLTCATYLNKRNIPFAVLEASDAVGGRVRTDKADGFLLDRGFQIFLTSYPEAKALLDYDALQLRPFQSGAIIRKNGRFHTMPNPLKNPLSAPQALLAPVGSLGDKLKILQLSTQVKSTENSTFFEPKTSHSTLAFLSQFGYSQEMIHSFFRPFFSGVFLEKELLTADPFFRFLFKQFASGDAVVPAQGMQAIPEQLAAKLPSGSIRLDARVQSIANRTVVLNTGEELQADTLVVATDAPQAKAWSPELPTIEFNSTVCLYFSASLSPFSKPMIAVNSDADGLINHVAVLSDVASSYAPAGQVLISVSIVGQAKLPDAELAPRVQRELVHWFGDQTKSWRHLRTYRIPHALPQYFPDSPKNLTQKLNDFTYCCGDYTAYPSLNGAMQSGREVAEMIVASLPVHA